VTDELKQRIIDFKVTFTSEQGARVLKNLDSAGLYHRDIYQADSDRQTCFNLGMNAIVRYIHHMIEMDPNEPKQNKVISQGVKL
jgi:hypothetical protein